LFQQQGFPLEKKNILVTRPIKETGSHKLSLKLKEGIPSSCILQIIPEGGVVAAGTEAVVAPIPVEGDKSAEEHSAE
jgi:hypothetical protein